MTVGIAMILITHQGLPATLYAPYGTPHEELRPEFLDEDSHTAMVGQNTPKQRVQPGWIGLVEILHRIEEQPYRRPVGRTIFQKIAYVATEEGLPTGLRYERSSFGPFTRELKSIITRLVNNGLIYEERQGRMFAVRVGQTFADARMVYAEKLEQWNSIIEKVVDLFLRMDTRQAEMAATVLFAARSLERGNSEQPTERQVLEEVMQWKQRRKPSLTESEVAWTVRNLAVLDWLQVRASRDLPLTEDELLYA